MQILVVINPVSGDRDKEDFIDKLYAYCEKHEIACEIYVTQKNNNSSKIEELVTRLKPDRVLIAGGDGTIVLTGKIIKQFDIPLGIIPFGSANGLATDLGIANDPEIAFIECMESDKIKNIDLIQVNKKFYCLHIGDLGLNANLIKSFDEDPNRGFLTYVRYIFKTLKNRKKYTFHIQADNKEYQLDGFMLSIANSSRYGTGAVLNPAGKTDDGIFEIVNLKNLDSSTVLNAGMTIFFEDANISRHIDVIACKKATIEVNENVELQLDGEFLGKHNRVDCEIVPGALRFIVP